MDEERVPESWEPAPEMVPFGGATLDLTNAPFLRAVLSDLLREAILDDFQAMPSEFRAAWRAHAAERYGFASYDDLRREVLG